MDKTLPKKIWLAGLGALARSEQEGEEWLSALMQEGEAFEKNKKEDLDQVLLTMMEKFKEGQTKAKHRLGNIENTFESKVSSALGRLGMVSQDDVNNLTCRLTEIEKKLEGLKETEK